jgi:hypothetical protein
MLIAWITIKPLSTLSTWVHRLNKRICLIIEIKKRKSASFFVRLIKCSIIELLLKSGQFMCYGSGQVYLLPTYGTMKRPLFVYNYQDHTVFPEDLSTLQFIEYLYGGSGGVYKLQDTSGNYYTFKAHPDINHIQEEIG